MVEVSFEELSLAYEFVGSAPPGENSAYLCRDTGRIYWTSGSGLLDEDTPDDLDISDRYVLVPHKTELGLGRNLALHFVASELPEAYDEVERFFRKAGAYARFKQLLQTNCVLEQWYRYETAAVEQALKDWCAENRIGIIENVETASTEIAVEPRGGGTC